MALAFATAYNNAVTAAATAEAFVSASVSATDALAVVFAHVVTSTLARTCAKTAQWQPNVGSTAVMTTAGRASNTAVNVAGFYGGGLAAGAGKFKVNYGTAARTFLTGVIVFSDANTAPANFATSIGTSAGCSASVAATANRIVADCETHNTATVASGGTDQTVRYARAFAGGITQPGGAASTQTGETSTRMSWGHTTTIGWAQVALGIRQLSGGAAPSSFPPKTLPVLGVGP